MPFKKGDNNINRKGRPRKQQCIPDILRKIGKEKIEAGGKKVSKMEALMRMVFKEAVAGNQWAVNFIADRTEGKPMQMLKQEIETTQAPQIELTIRPDRMIESGDNTSAS